MDERRKITRTVTIAKKDSLTPLLAYLSSRFTYQGEEEWKAHIEDGRVTHNGNACSGNEMLREKDVIAFTPEPYDEPPINPNFTILYEDERFIFVNKPPLLPCHPGGIYLYNTLWHLLREKNECKGLINRLDRETSGIVIAAKTVDAAAYANALMRERDVVKEYRAIVEGFFPGYLDASGRLVADTGSPVRKKLRFIPDDLPKKEESEAGADNRCRSEFDLERIIPGGMSVVRARLHTGRTHQIRATLESLGFPVVGDKLYGKDPTIFLRFATGTMTDSDRAALRMEHQALHCSRVSFAKPDGGLYDVRAESPSSWLPESHGSEARVKRPDSR